VIKNHTIRCERYNKVKEMTSSTLTQNESSPQTLKHSISLHDKHGPFKRKCDEEQRCSVSPIHLPSPAIKEEYEQPLLPSVESRTYNPEHIQFRDPDVTSRLFNFRFPYSTHRSPSPLADNKAQDYETSRSGGCTSDCAIVEFRIKSDQEVMFKGPDTAFTNFLHALPEIARIFPQFS